jgi:serpin B
MQGVIKKWVMVALVLVVSAGTAVKPEAVAKTMFDAGSQVVNGNNWFAFDLYGQLREKDGNLFFSPYSISTALAMTYAGARGNTEKQMAETLRFGVKGDALHKTFGELVKALNQAGDKGPYQLAVANALWGQQDYQFLDAFTTLVEKSYGAGLNRLDFQKQTEAARQTINRWVEDQTQEKIKDLLKPGVLDPLTRLVLTNAIYFKGNWASQFKKDATQDAPFTLADGKKVNVPMMFQKGDFKYGGNNVCQILELPYEGDDLSMLVLLPKAAGGLTALEKGLSPEWLAKWAKPLRKQEVQVYLPKFTMTSEFGLKDVLVKLGMKDAFNAGAADFSGMDGSKELFISAVVHKAFVDVNEEGTEAAAATAVVVGTTAMMEPTVFRADRPFVFLIRDNKTGSILFIGRVANPKE